MTSMSFTFAAIPWVLVHPSDYFKKTLHITAEIAPKLHQESPTDFFSTLNITTNISSQLPKDYIPKLLMIFIHIIETFSYYW